MLQSTQRLCSAALLGVALLLLAGAQAAHAQTQAYPSKSIKIIVPYAPGGGTDILARLLAQQLSIDWGHSAVVENRPGANGMIGAELVAKSPPDGHTLMLVVAAHVINPSIYAKVPYDAIADFAAVTLVASSPWVVVVNGTLPAANIKELIALARSQPGKLSFGSSEPSSRLAGELFKSMAGIDLLHVPYKGGAQIMNDMLGGHIAVGFTSVPTVSQHYKSGKLHVLAVAGKSRSRAMPDVPTATEAGLPGYEPAVWYGMYAPAGTPRDIVARIQQQIAKIVKQADVRERLDQLGADAIASTPEEFAAFSREELARYAKVVKDAGIKPE